jgi:hypothetical protein
MIIGLCAPFAQSVVAQPIALPNDIKQCERSLVKVCGTWTGNGQRYAATWSNGTKAIVTVTSFDGHAIVLHRIDANDSANAGMTADYVGEINGSSMKGRVTYTWPGHQPPIGFGTWDATFTAATSAVSQSAPPQPAEAAAPTPTAPPTPTGMAASEQRANSSPSAEVKATVATAVSVGQSQPPWRSLTDVFLWREDTSGRPNLRWIQRGNVIGREGVAAQQLGPADLMTKEQFGDFELEFKWMYASVGEPGGVGYRVTDELVRSVFSAPQYEFVVVPTPPRNILMDASGGVRGLYPGKQGLQTDLPGKQWSTARIVAHGSHVEHWYNGNKVAEFDTESSEWKARVKASEFAKYANFARAPKGRIAIDGYPAPLTTIALSDIKIRVYDEPAPARYVFVDPDPPPVQSGLGAAKSFQAVCITDAQGPEKVSYITAAFFVAAPRETSEIEKSWLEHVSRTVPAGDGHLGGRCWTTGASQDRARMMIENQIRQDALNGITDKPLTWAYVAEQARAVVPTAPMLQGTPNERVSQLSALDQQVTTEREKLLAQMDAAGARGKAEVTEELGVWQVQRQKDCGAALATRRDREGVYQWYAAIAKSDAQFSCMIAKAGDRIALYRKVQAELAAHKVSAATWASIGVK